MIKYKSHRKVKFKDVCGFCGCVMENTAYGWKCPNNKKKVKTMTKFDWKSLAVGVTSLIVVVGTALIIMSPVKHIDPVAMQCLGYESNAPAMIRTIGLVIGFIVGSIFTYTIIGNRKEVK